MSPVEYIPFKAIKEIKVAELNSDTNKGTTTTTTATTTTATTATTTTATTTTTTIVTNTTITTTKGVILIQVAIGTKFNTVVCGINRSLNPDTPTTYDGSKYISIIGDMDTISNFSTKIELITQQKLKKVPKGNPNP